MVPGSNLGRELTSEFRSADSWVDKVNVSALSDDVRRSILGRVRRRLGFVEAAKALGIAKSSLHRYLSVSAGFQTMLLSVLCGTWINMSSRLL